MLLGLSVHLLGEPGDAFLLVHSWEQICWITGNARAQLEEALPVLWKAAPCLPFSLKMREQVQLGREEA